MCTSELIGSHRTFGEKAAEPYLASQRWLSDRTSDVAHGKSDAEGEQEVHTTFSNFWHLSPSDIALQRRENLTIEYFDFLATENRQVPPEDESPSCDVWGNAHQDSSIACQEMGPALNSCILPTLEHYPKIWDDEPIATLEIIDQGNNVSGDADSAACDQLPELDSSDLESQSDLALCFVLTNSTAPSVFEIDWRYKPEQVTRPAVSLSIPPSCDSPLLIAPPSTPLDLEQVKTKEQVLSAKTLWQLRIYFDACEETEVEFPDTTSEESSALPISTQETTPSSSPVPQKAELESDPKDIPDEA